MKSITLHAPAKLNLFLRVIGKRKDGYHAIETLFERIDLSDRMTFKRTRSGEIRIFCTHPDVPTTKRNLAWQAAYLLQDRFAIGNGVDITITKQIPVAAGLGGGSSNAAATLLALNKLWRLSLTKSELIDCGRHIGSDVPFFLQGCSFAVGREKGDAITPLNLKKKLWHILIIPRVKVYTPQVYRAMKMRLTKRRGDVNMLIHALKIGEVFSRNRLISNDLETAIVQLHPSLLVTKNRIKTLGVTNTSFSGSGPTIFSVIESKSQAYAWAALLKRYYTRVFVARTI